MNQSPSYQSSRSARRRRENLLVLLAAGFLAVGAPGARALDIHGHVVNGTTDEPVTGATLVIVNPSAGMLVEKELTLENADGSFVFSGLNDSRSIYLLRILYDGVNYTEIIRASGQSQIHREIRVFDTITSWDDVTFSVPHMILSRSGDSLKVEKFFQITNNTSPPHTVYGPDTRFTFYLPGDIMKIDRCYVTSLGIPLPRTPIATDEPGFYTVDYPVKPGVTRMAISFSLPYAAGHYAYVEKLKYPLKDMTVLSEDASFRVESDDTALEQTDEQGFVSYRVADLPAGAVLKLEISGGSNTSAAPPQSAMPKITIVPSRTNTLSLVILMLLTVVLFGVFATAASRRRNRKVEKRILEGQKDSLLDQLAKLDDLFATGTVPDEVYRIKRAELANALAQIYYRLKGAEGSQASTPDNTKGSARV
ncbi:MAG: carboxypeptidase-like regulatory domain-containing protein [bacterium]|nr:carboxypeptidase-like regulatory domain-containing protein [bacterium]